MNKLLSPDDLAALLDIKKSTLFSHLSRGVDLPQRIKIGSQSRWRLEDVEAWIEAKLKERRRKDFED